MALTLDASSESSEISGTTSITWSHTCSGSQRVLIVAVTARHSSAAPGIPTGVTYNGVAMTLEVSRSNAQSFIDFGSGPIVSIWSLIAPAGGANNVVVSFSANISVSATAAAVSFNGADQADSVEATNSAEGGSTASSVVVTTLSAGAWVVDALYHLDAGPLTVGAGQTARSNRSVNSSGDSVGVSTDGPVASPGAVDMTWTTGVSAFWAAAAVAVKAAAESAQSDKGRDLRPGPGIGPDYTKVFRATLRGHRVLANEALIGSSAAGFTCTGILTGDGALAGTSAMAFSPSAVLIGDGALLGAIAVSFSGSGTLSSVGSGEMAGAASIAISATGTMAGEGALIGGPCALSFTATGLLQGTGELAGAVSIAFSASAQFGNGQFVSPDGRYITFGARLNSVRFH